MARFLGCGIGGGIKGDFKKALENYYSKYPAHFGTIGNYLCDKYPCNMDKNSSLTQQLNLLCKVGLLSQKPVEDPTQYNPWPNQQVGPNAIQYSLTDLGKQYFRQNVSSSPMMGEAGFIFGDIKVLDINDYSEPANQMGQMISNVKYQTKVENIASWANSDELRASFHEIKEAYDSQTTPENQEATLVKMASGWVHSDLASQ